MCLCPLYQHAAWLLQVRCIAMDATDGLTRGQGVINTGEPIKVPVGRETLGRIMNVIGEPVDEKGPIREWRLAPVLDGWPLWHCQNAVLHSARWRKEVVETVLRRPRCCTCRCHRAPANAMPSHACGLSVARRCAQLLTPARTLSPRGSQRPR